MNSKPSSLLFQQFREKSVHYLNGLLTPREYISYVIVFLNELCTHIPSDVYSSAEAMALARACKDLGLAPSDAVESRTVGNYTLEVVPIHKLLYSQLPDGVKRPENDVTVEQDAFAIRSVPHAPAGFYFYAYATPAMASEVMRRMSEDPFDDHTHRVNFSNEINPLVVVTKLRERRS